MRKKVVDFLPPHDDYKHEHRRYIGMTACKCSDLSDSYPPGSSQLHCFQKVPEDLGFHYVS